MIQEKFAKLSDYKEEREGCLSLLFDGRVLENDKPFAEYLAPRDGRVQAPSTGTASSPGLNARVLRKTQGAKQSWPKPFAGSSYLVCCW